MVSVAFMLRSTFALGTSVIVAENVLAARTGV